MQQLAEPPLYVKALVDSKKTLLWATEVSHFGLDSNEYCLEAVLKRLPKMREIFVCRRQYDHTDGHHDSEVVEMLSARSATSSPLALDSSTSTNFSLLAAGGSNSVLSVKRIECRLPENLIGLVLR